MSAELIGALRVTLGMDSAAFEQGANRAVAKMDAVSKAGYLTGRSLRIVAETALAAGAAIAAAFTVQAVKQALDYAASIGEVASQLGVTTTELQVYRYAATQVNLTQEELEKGLAKLTLTLGKAASGAKAEASYFQTLGIAVKDAEGNIRPTGDVLLDLADRLAAIPDPAQRAAAVFAIFGRQGQKLIPLLEGGSDGLKQFAAQAEEAGAVIAEGDIARADQTADKIEALTQQLKVDFSREVAENADAILALAKALASLIGWLAKAGSAYIGFWSTVGTQAGRALKVNAAAGSPTAQGAIQLLQWMGIGGKKQGGGGAQPPAQPEGPTLDLEDLFNRGGGGGGRGGGSRRDRTGDIRDQLTDLRDDIEKAFRTDAIPESTREADELREKLDDIAETARKAGVPMGQFAGQVATLKARISELETAGLAAEARDFSREVEQLSRNVEELDSQAMEPINRRLGDITQQFDGLRDRILEEIEANAQLSASNESAQRTMQDLVRLLGQLRLAREQATASAIAQYRAEQNLLDIQAAQAGQDIQSNITDLQRARGDTGPFTSAQLEMQQAERGLAEERLNALGQLAALQAQLTKAETDNDQQEIARLNGLIGLQEQYYDLVTTTSAEQLIQATRLQTAYEDFTNGLTDALEDFVTKGEFSFNRLGDLLLSFLNDLFLKPALEGLSEGIGGLLKGGLSSLFAGGFATGGVIPRGKWGIVGENGPEPVFAADAPMRVLPTDALGGGGATFNINVNGAMSDRDARRTGNQIGAAAARTFATARKAGIAG